MKGARCDGLDVAEYVRRGWSQAGRCGAVTKLAAVVGAPASNSTGIHQCTGVKVAHGDGLNVAE